MIRFIEHSSSNYRERTNANAKADLTIAFAVDFTTAGERCTKACVEKNRKQIVQIDLMNLHDPFSKIDMLVTKMRHVRWLNIAGNGTYTLQTLYTEQELLTFFEEFFKQLLSRLEPWRRLTIGSGGQTGVDELAIRAIDRLQERSARLHRLFVLAPKGWKMRSASGIDVANETSFKYRFLDLRTFLTFREIDFLHIYQAEYRSIKLAKVYHGYQNEFASLCDRIARQDDDALAELTEHSNIELLITIEELFNLMTQSKQV